MFCVMKAKNAEPLEIHGIRLGPELTEEQARAIFALGEQAVVFALLAQAKSLAEHNGDRLAGSRRDDPSCPSGQKAPYEKPNQKRRKKKPGCKQGHEGHCRAKPDHVDHREQHRASHCPDCGGTLKKCNVSRQRYIEDIPQDVHVEITEHTIHRDWCPRCRKMVEPKVPDALPNATIGNRLLVMSAWLHYALGNTISQILSVFNFHLQFILTPGGLVQMWHRLAEILKSWYEEIAEEIVLAGVLHADETGWRINGLLGWLWCFTTPSATLFAIERSRASPVVLKFITEQFAGVLVSDFWAAYNILVCAKQKCLVHLLRDLERVERYKDTGGDWARFAKKLRRLIRDAIRLRKRRDEMAPATYERRYHRIEQRLRLMIEMDWTNREARRLVKRLRRHQHELFTFVLGHEVPFENNFAERIIRQAVIMRKNSYNNRSDKGASTQAILMSVFTTLKQRGLNPIKIVEQALRTYITTGKLPALKDFTPAQS
jgi:transposase